MPIRTRLVKAVQASLERLRCVTKALWHPPRLSGSNTTPDDIFGERANPTVDGLSKYAVRLQRRHRETVLVVSLVMIVSLAFTLVSTWVAVQHEQRAIEAQTQAAATSLARSVDLKLKTYHAALETIAQSYSLVEEYNLQEVEREAGRVGALFGGWFVITTGDKQVRQLMNTRVSSGLLPDPYARAIYPELLRAEEQSLRLGRAVTSDAFIGRVANELVVSTVTAIPGPDNSTSILGFVVTLNDITAWLREADLTEGHFAAIADGSRRVIARSHDNEDFILAGLPDWYIAFSDGRNSGVAVGAPLQGGAPRLFAMQRLELAPGWTLAVSRPLPSPLSATYRAAWPALLGFFVLLLSSSIAALYLDGSRARAETVRVTAQVAEREQLLSEVREADARKVRLMAVLAHDLRTPLIALIGSVDLLQSDQDEAVRLRMLKRIQDDGYGMLQLIDDVLELARLGAGEARLRPQPFELAELLNQVADIVRPQAERNATDVKVLADAIPTLEGDVMSLRRVLLNFATNAVKATRGGSILLSATYEPSDTNAYTVTCAVTDTGSGIKAEDLDLLFRDFGILERGDPDVDGTGLGLAICRRLATAMGGEVGVESTPGKGSRFWLRLRLPGAQNATTVSDNTPRNSTNMLAGMRVLVAEDHPLIRQVTCEQLARLGMLTTAAEDGDIAVALSEGAQFDLILMDLQMPRLDGNKAATRIRRGGGPSAQAPIICLTAHNSPEITVKLSAHSFDGYLNKPLDTGQLTDLLQGTARALPATMSSEEFDSETLQQLREMHEGALLMRTLKAFSADIATAQTELATLIANGDLLAAARVVHKLVGLSDMLSARTLSTELRKLETLIRTEDIETLHAALQTADDVMRRTRTQLDHLILLEESKSLG